MEKIDVLYTEEQIKECVKRVARQIEADFDGEEIVFVGILKGAFMFISDLAREVNLNTKIDFISVSSYGQKTTSSGVVKLIKDLDNDIAGKNVIIVEDIVDTGLTLKYLSDLLQQRKPKTIKLCTLLDKESRRQVNIKADYVGFQIKDYFVVGYGIDYAQKYRGLPYVGHVILEG